jgi:TIR domain/Pentapeptide repeats (8 copies)
MANQEHLDILKQGVEVWNQWRMNQESGLVPDLSGVNFTGVNLSHADLIFADLHGADLSHATLYATHLLSANLAGTTLCFANLTQADLTIANFTRADLTNTDLSFTNFNQAVLGSTNFTDAKMAYTSLGDVDLSTAKGLETVRQYRPTNIGIATIYRSGGNIPEIFLRKAGIPDTMIEYMRSLVGKPIDYYSCFISYSSKNQDFADRLHADLLSNGVRCWFAPHDMRPGTVILRGIDEAIRQYDKLLLILSKYSVESNWVEHEVDMALFKEMQKKRQDVLFPIRLDNAILKSPSEWAKNLCHRHIGDFTKWKDHDNYQQVFNRLLRDLKAETAKVDREWELGKEILRDKNI